MTLGPVTPSLRVHADTRHRDAALSRMSPPGGNSEVLRSIQNRHLWQGKGGDLLKGRFANRPYGGFRAQQRGNLPAQRRRGEQCFLPDGDRPGAFWKQA